jgi:hypothetical protein
MIEDRLFLREPDPFALVMERCADIQNRANAIAANGAKAYQLI